MDKYKKLRLKTYGPRQKTINKRTVHTKNYKSQEVKAQNTKIGTYKSIDYKVYVV